ncbi:MAG: 1,4-dihydroxy-2-naphthoate polyprenyltransferase [Cyclobacteriaceae bacterium]
MSKTAAWFQAFRLRTLPLAFSSIFMSAFIAWKNGVFDEWIFVLTLLTTLFLQVLSNLANDYGDAKSGVDSMDREGPSRAVQAGLISASEMKSGIIICGSLSLISGVVLILLSFQDNWALILLFMLIGLSAIVAAVKYTMGKNPYGYAGLGDVFVLLFFGFVGVCGSYYLYAQTMDWSLIYPALSCGLLAVGVLNVNNIRDINSDRKAGKKSIPVRIGRQKAVLYHSLLLSGALLAGVLYMLDQGTSILSWLFLLVGPLLYLNLYAVKSKPLSDLDPNLKQLALSTLLFVILFGVGLLLS